MDNMPLLKVIDIHKYYGRIHAVKGISFAINKGEILGLVGDNGAGKSSLLKVLSGYHHQDKGEVFIEGKKVNISSPAYARSLGIETVYQERALVDSMSLARNFYMGREPVNRAGFLNREKMAECIGVVQKLGLSINSADYLVGNLSGGQRQGVAIGRAMYFKAKLVLLDEPTTALSVKEVHKVLDLVLEFKQANISVIFITHNLQHVYDIADRFLVLENGKKVEDVIKSDTSVEDLTKAVIGEIKA
ncbi:MAG: sugar ABC transporter ATP-binding protein [Actinobacteria bacterium]|nr:sugar ABC transporter ATP-binding protein [Actinomycetota bacterium]